jgi:hypothetical protein
MSWRRKEFGDVTYLVGSGAGFSGDRTDAGGPVLASIIRRGLPGALMFETLGERTLALAQLARRQEREGGYEPLLVDYLRPVLARAAAAGVPVVGNFGAANPIGAARRILALGRELGLRSLRVGVVTGDDLLEGDAAMLPPELRTSRAALISANAYLGARPIADALQAGAQVVVTGRVADPSLTLGPLLAHYAWRDDDWERLGRGTMAGHLIECGAQVTGGYFADPGCKDVPDLAHVGFPIVEVEEGGDFVIGKAEDTGGLVDPRTVKEQMLYEVHDPSAYLTPDVVADISRAEVEVVGADRVAVHGVTGSARPATLKVTACFEGGWLGEGEISYAGPQAEQRARLALEVLRARADPSLAFRGDLIGAVSVFADDGGRLLGARHASAAGATGARAAVAGEREPVGRFLREVQALYCCGPAGGGGIRVQSRPRLSSQSFFIPREAVRPRVEVLEL